MSKEQSFTPSEACPFCGAGLTRLIADFVPNTGCNRRFIRCMECHAQGPWSTKAIDEVEGWQKRALQSETVARQDIPEGRGSLPAGALERGSPLDAARGVNPGGAAPGGVSERCDDKKCAVHPDAAWPFPTKPRSVAPSAGGRIEELEDELQVVVGQRDWAFKQLKALPSAIARIDPMEFGRLKAELSAIERHLNRAGVARVSEKQATSDRVVGLIRNGVPSAPMMVGGFCTDRERCVADRDLLARAYEILWDGDGGPEGVDIANDIVATLKQPHAMILDRATKNATDRSTPK